MFQGTYPECHHKAVAETTTKHVPFRHNPYAGCAVYPYHSILSPAVGNNVTPVHERHNHASAAPATAAALAELEQLRERILYIAQELQSAHPTTAPPTAAFQNPIGTNASPATGLPHHSTNAQVLSAIRDTTLLLGQCVAAHPMGSPYGVENAGTVTPNHMQARKGNGGVNAAVTAARAFGAASTPTVRGTNHGHTGYAPSRTPSPAAERAWSSSSAGRTDEVRSGDDGLRPSERPRYTGKPRTFVYKASPANKTPFPTPPTVQTWQPRQERVVERVPVAEHYGRWPPAESCFVTLLEFKRQPMRRCCTNVALPVGKYLLVAGDRGTDCALAVQCGFYDADAQEMLPDSVVKLDEELIDTLALRGEVVPFLREATESEVQHLCTLKPSVERLALKVCRKHVAQLQLAMNVIDCEYQFDGTKIIFYFEASRPCDFRQLNRELFRTFNARVWLENVCRSTR